MLEIYGHSDDCIEVVGPHRGDTEFYLGLDKPLSLIVNDFTFDVGVIVTLEYGPGDAGVWRVAVEPQDEDKPMPPMGITLAKNGYSPMLMIDCSENTAVSAKGK